MFPSNRQMLAEMAAQPWFRELSYSLDELFHDDPNYSPRKMPRILEAAARGDRVIRFGSGYVISSFLPPLPSRAFTTFLTGGTDRSSLFTDLAYLRRSAPLTVHVCITQRCFYRCKHCGATTPADKDDLTTAQWIRALRSIQDAGVAYAAISGGEPLLRSDLEEILGALDDRTTLLMFTNGRMLTARRAQALKQAGLFFLAVSIDSPIAARHDELRGHAGAFHKAIEAVHNAREAGLYTVISSVIYRKDLENDYIHRLFELAAEHGAHEVRVHQPIPRGALADVPNASDIFWTRKDMAWFYRQQFLANRNIGGRLKVSSFPYTEGPCKFGCGAGVLHSYINAAGDLWPCDFVPLTFGNLLQEPAKDIYARMIAAAGYARPSCCARRIAPELQAKDLPLRPHDALALLPQYRSTSYPRFFKTLQTPEPIKRRKRPPQRTVWPAAELAPALSAMSAEPA